jgi:hypothetical protein
MMWKKCIIKGDMEANMASDMDGTNNGVGGDVVTSDDMEIDVLVVLAIKQHYMSGKHRQPIFTFIHD